MSQKCQSKSCLIPGSRSLALAIFLVQFLLQVVANSASADTKKTVVAKVNGVEISAEEFDSYLKRRISTGALKPGPISKQQKDIELHYLIQMYLADRELLKDPRTNTSQLKAAKHLSALEAALAYLIETRVQIIQNVSDEEYLQFVEAHPNYFSKRRNFYFSHLEIEKKVSMLPWFMRLQRLRART